MREFALQLCETKSHFSYFPSRKAYSPITAVALRFKLVVGERNWKNSIGWIESDALFRVGQVGFYIVRRLNDRAVLGGLIFNRAQMPGWECLRCMNNWCLSEGVAWGL